MSGQQIVLIQRKKFTTTFTENDLSSVFSRDDEKKGYPCMLMLQGERYAGDLSRSVICFPFANTL